ncbi:MAG: GtrA family protein [Parcubacteria group bacterium]|nr:GtrA family protein [Parcubacteria group bacterium]
MNQETVQQKFTSQDGVPSVILGMMVGFFLAVVLANIGLNNLPNFVFKFGSRFPNLFFISFLLIIPILAISALWIAFRLGKKYPVIFQFGKFANVGFANFFTDAGIYNVLVFLFGIGLSGSVFVLFKTLGFLAALTNSFFWNKFWTFKVKEKENIASESLQFILVTFLSLGINVGVAFLINSFAPSSIDLKLWSNLAVASGAASSFIWNFLGYKFIVFKK